MSTDVSNNSFKVFGKEIIMSTDWKAWDDKYGEVLYRRAIGELPEMESSKVIAKKIKYYYKDNDKILDVGCGAGHYLKSLKRIICQNINYTGVDINEEYIALAKKAFSSHTNCKFMVSSIFDLDFSDDEFEIVTCNNTFPALKSIEKPLMELTRVASKNVIIRLLCGEKAYSIKEINPEKEIYNEKGEPEVFNYINIYGIKYIEELLRANSKIKNWTIRKDTEFEKSNIMNSSKEHSKNAVNVTKIIGGYQVSGYIILPWSIIEIQV